MPVLVFCLGSISWAVQAQSGRSREWLTWGGDTERTGWNRGETTLSKQTVGRLALKWKTQIDKEVSIEIESGNSMLTAPLVAQGVRTPQGPKTVVYTLSAVEHAGGARRRDRRHDLAAHVRQHGRASQQPPNWICTNISTATPVIDKAKNIIYMLAADGRLHGVDLATGEAKAGPAAGIRDAVLAQLEPESRGRRALHDRRTRVRQWSCAGSAGASARNHSRRRRAAAG